MLKLYQTHFYKTHYGISVSKFCKNAWTSQQQFLYLHIFLKTFFNKYFIDSTPSKSPSEGVKYFFHFHKDFINRYGSAHDAWPFTDQQITARLSQMNCEFLTRPNIAISEFADTLLANTQYLEENILVLDGRSMAKFFHKMENYKDALRVLNSKNDTEGNT